ncbi:protocadherin gamma-C5-like isoform X43 [Pelobates fuscus]|uniref:protocadherin gamma-C5-like isoform X43 n=1 Tax=Pelobates fuscus TaxID=191477 RepID=UPI002FE4F085
MDFKSFQKAWKRQVVYSFYLCSLGWVSGQLHYSILEESETGTLVGNVAHDLGLNLENINNRKLTLGTEGARLFAADQNSGDLTTNGRIDRESICGSSLKCLLHLEAVLDNPLELYSLEIEVVDINDNSPIFTTTEQIIKVTELLTSPGVRFPLDIAQDSDVGINGVRQYKLNPNPYFSLSVTNRQDGTLIAELILQKVLDREEKGEHKLTLTAFDGGEHPRSGSTQQAQPNTEWRFSQAQRPGPSGAQPTEEAGVWPNNQFETERLQAMILASANEAAEGTSGLGGGTGTMGLSARYGPQFTLQHVPDYRQNVYIPGSTLTPTNGAGKREGKASGNKKKSGKKEKK